MARVSVLFVSGLLCLLVIVTPVYAAMGDVVLSFEAQAHNSTGLTWVDGYLWNIGHGHYEPAELLKLDPTDGSELLRIYLPIEHVMGLTWDGNTFWAVSHETSIIYQLNATDGSIIKSFQSPNPGTVETGCEGMAWDGQYLWYADSDFDRIYQLDPMDGTEISSFSSPGSKPQGLAWDGMYLWHFDYNTNLVYRLDSTDGSVQHSFSAPGVGQGDLAWENGYLWLSRNVGDTIYKIDVNSVPPVAVAGEDQIINEGENVFFSGAASYDSDGIIVTYEWDFDAKVDSDDDGIPSNDVDATGPEPMFTYGDNGIYIVLLNVTDDEGFYGTDTCIITVNNLAPTIDPLGPFTVNEGDYLSINASVLDPGSDDLTFRWNLSDGTPINTSTYYNDGVSPDPYPSPQGIFPFSVIDEMQYVFDNDGICTINLTVEDDDGGLAYYLITITVVNIPCEPPVLYINTSEDKHDAVLYWDPPANPDIDHYLLYRSTSQMGFKFNNVWVNTSKDMEQGESCPDPLRTIWNDTNAAFCGNGSFEEQYYYIIQSVDEDGEVSSTSRTVGKWTKSFPQGTSTFSLPLKPFENLTVDYYLNDMNATHIKWIHPQTHIWMKHGEGVSNETQMRLGEGYEVRFENITDYTFCGMPGAMIGYDGDSGFMGFNFSSDTKGLTVNIESNGDVSLFWQEPSSMSSGDWYMVYYSNLRDGFFGILNESYFEIGPCVYYGNNSAIHVNAQANNLGSRLFYMVVAFNASGVMGSSTYSMGVWTEEYTMGYDTFGIPLKLTDNHTADWFCDNIPEVIGINFHDNERWCWHSTLMPEGAFDPDLAMTVGYQISISNVTKFTFIGI